MSDLTQVTNHVERALDRLLHQFKTSEQLNAFLTAVLGPVQTVENDLWALYTERWPADAVGAQLDNLGEIVGQERGGLDDDDYRLYIQARILINRSTGKANDTLQLLELIAGSAEVSVHEQFPAAYRVEGFDLGTLDPQTIFNLLSEVKPAGVRLHFVYSPEPIAGLFRYDTPGQGYDSDAVYAGGIA